MTKKDFALLNLTPAFVGPNCAPRADLPPKNAFASEKPFIEDERTPQAKRGAKQREQGEAAAAKRSADTERTAGRSLVTAPLVCELPIEAVNTSNSREHWRPLAARAKSHRFAARMAMQPLLTLPPLRGPWTGLVVTLTRIAPRSLDDDGNVTSLKAVRDGVADALGLVTDRDPRITWAYSQRRGSVRFYAVEVSVSERGSGGVNFEVKR